MTDARPGSEHLRNTGPMRMSPLGVGRGWASRARLRPFMASGGAACMVARRDREPRPAIRMHSRLARTRGP